MAWPRTGVPYLDRARARVTRHATRDTRHGWSNGELVQTAADQARLGKHVDGALLFLTHDIVRSPEALANIVGQLSSGDRVAVMGPKDAAPGLLPVNVVVRALLSRFAGHVDELRDPWDHVERLIPNLHLKPIALGGAYIAWAAFRELPRANSAGANPGSYYNAS